MLICNNCNTINPDHSVLCENCNMKGNFTFQPDGVDKKTNHISQNSSTIVCGNCGSDLLVTTDKCSNCNFPNRQKSKNFTAQDYNNLPTEEITNNLKIFKLK